MGAAASLLARPYPAALGLLLAAWLAFLPAALGRLRRRLAGAKAGTGYLLAALVLGGLALRLAMPAAHRVYYDEFEHLDVARRVAATGVFAETLAGGLPGWDVAARPTWPGGHHVSLAAAFTLFGASETTAFRWSALLSALSALFVFWAAFEAFDDARAALSAAAVWTLSPLALTWAGAADLTSPSLFWCSAALAALHARERAPGTPALDAFAALSLAYSVQVRPEIALLLIYAAALRAPARVLIPGAISLAFPASIALINRAEALPGYGAATGPAVSNILRQLGPNLRFLISRPESLLVLMLGAVGAASRRRAAALAALSCGFLAAYCAFFRGRFDTGSEDRYALSVLLPLAVAGAAALPRAAVPATLVAAGLAFRGPTPADPRREAARRFLARAAAELPPEAVIVAFNPPFVRVVAERPAAWSYLVLEDLDAFEKARAAAGSAPELVLYKDWAWRARPADAARLEALLAKGYEARVAADNGLDSLTVLSPRLRGRR